MIIIDGECTIEEYPMNNAITIVCIVLTLSALSGCLFTEGQE